MMKAKPFIVSELRYSAHLATAASLAAIASSIVSSVSRSQKRRISPSRHASRKKPASSIVHGRSVTTPSVSSVLSGMARSVGSSVRRGGSVFGESGKVLLGFPVPPHASYGMLPSALHLLQGALVRFVALCDHFLQMLVLRLDDLISGVSTERDVTRSTHLLACHRFHPDDLLSRHPSCGRL